MERWLESLALPWRHIAMRWAQTLGLGAVAQRAVVSAGVALREWWPTTCRPAMLATWGRTLERPQRSGESAESHRRRLATWRDEPVGRRGWVRDEVQRVTGARRVIEWPRDGLRIGSTPIGAGRIGAGPKLMVGAAPDQQEAVRAALEPGLPADAGLTVVAPDVFDAI